MKTIGKGIVSVEFSPAAIPVALVSADVFVTLATFFKLPVSTSQAIVGGVAGVEVNLFKIFTIVHVWVICPFLTAFLAFLIGSSRSRQSKGW